MGHHLPRRSQRGLLAAIVAVVTTGLLLAPATAGAAEPHPTLQPGRAAAEQEARDAARVAPTTAERATK
ncbi:hypothetical protein QWJ41_21530, partial [Nocardioides sp. SOB44]